MRGIRHGVTSTANTANTANTPNMAAISATAAIMASYLSARSYLFNSILVFNQPIGLRSSFIYRFMKGSKSSCRHYHYHRQYYPTDLPLNIFNTTFRIVIIYA